METNLQIVPANGRAASIIAIKEFVRSCFTRFTRQLPDDTSYPSEEIQSLAMSLQDTTESRDIFDNLDDHIIDNLALLWTVIKECSCVAVCQQESDYFFLEKLQECLKVLLLLGSHTHPKQFFSF